MKVQQHIGKTTAETQVVIEYGMVQRFVTALGIEDPLSNDPAAAKAAGLSGLMLPLVAAGSLGDYQSVISLLELKPKQVLHSGETISVFEPLCVGDTLIITTRLREIYEQQVAGNPMGFATIDVIGASADKKSRVQFEAQRVIAVRGGFPRR